MTTDPRKNLLERAASLVAKTAEQSTTVKTAAPVLWKYTDDEGKEFYLPEKKTGTLKSPYTGKSFTAKPSRSSLSDVGKELKEEAKTASSPAQWELAAEILDKGEDHPALKVVKTHWEDVLKGVAEGKRRSMRMKSIGVGRTEDPTMVMLHVAPALKELGETALVVAKQLKDKLE